jgi:hypothetical protein
MGTQWATRGGEPGDEAFGLRSGYRPRHAKSARRLAPRRDYVGGSAHSWPSARGVAEPYTISGCANYGYGPVSVRRILRNRAATFVREHSRRYGDEQWLHPG